MRHHTLVGQVLKQRGVRIRTVKAGHAGRFAALPDDELLVSAELPAADQGHNDAVGGLGPDRSE
eukprot:290258-Chlamydomonas_euryale.AAC.1